MTDPEDSELWTEGDYAAIDAVAPYDPNTRYYTAEEVFQRARTRTHAWLQETEA